MKIFKEFKEFAVKGNAIDMAVGIVIGAAFGSVVQSLVSDVITPPLGRILGDVDFSNLFINLSSSTYPSVSAAKAAGAATLNYGLFINSVISFVIIGFALFALVKVINKLKRPTAEKSLDTSTKICQYCQMEISIKAVKCPHCTSSL